MKKLLFALLFLPFLSLAQNPPLKRANTIIIETTDSSQVLYKNVIQAFKLAGLTVAGASIETGSISSTPTPVKSAVCTINSNIIENKIVLTGTFQVPLSQAVVGYTPVYKVANKGLKGSEFLETWLLMQKVALSYPNATLNYEIR